LQDENVWFRKDLFAPESQLPQERRKPAVLIAEREKTARQAFKEPLLRRGFAVIESTDKNAALEKLRTPSIDLILIGSLENGAAEGLELARRIRNSNRNLPIIFIASESSEELAIAALRTGVNEYFKQPYSLADVVTSINRYLSNFPSSRPQQFAKESSPKLIDGHRMIGESLAMRDIRATIGRVALTDSNVLITGETGTGKELVAELIHNNSGRAREPLVCINCAAIPDSLLESELFGYERGSFTGAYVANKGKLKFGDGGTIFLDEIGDMSPESQAKILRVIESRKLQRLGGRENISLNVRFLAATNKDLQQSVAEKTFRKDLYYRLNVAAIHLPLLRERKEDIPALCAHYIRHFNDQFDQQIEGVTEQVAEMLLRYDWPGNVRELKNLLEATIGNLGVREANGESSELAFRGLVSFTDLPEQFRRSLKSIEGFAKDDRHPLLSILMATNWNISKTAQQLNWSRMTVYRKMAKYQILRKGKL
jgi:DNA-binding NtrC family response regulator